MKTLEHIADAAVENDAWIQLQLQIARRADELARRRVRAGRDPDDRECWLDAERDVLSREHDLLRV